LTPTQIEIPRWTAQEFERLVLASDPKVAVFDCDGTLWSGEMCIRDSPYSSSRIAASRAGQLAASALTESTTRAICSIDGTLGKCLGSRGVATNEATF